ncbi:MAG: hypothetical protein ABSG57_11200 [Candidatus Bathyarchaeia archaeon]
MSIPTVEENLERLRKLREKILEYVDFTISEAEADKARHNASQTPIQGKEAEQDAKYDPEDESKDNYPMHEGR